MKPVVRPALRRAVATFVAAGALTVAVSPAHAGPFGAAAVTVGQSSLYLVVLDAAPLATYDGTVSGYAATVPDQGTRFRASRPAVRAYRSLLEARQRDVLDSIGDPRIVYSYTTAINGFAADLTNTQVKQLTTMPQVLTVEPSTKQRLDGDSSSATPPAVRLDDVARSGSRSRVRDPAGAGRGVVIAMVDSGIWPDNPSFAGVPVDARTLQRRYPGFTGICQPGERWSRQTCNAKVLSARYFVDGFGADNLSSSEYLSPRDANGHGSHTAGIAAGNPGVAVHIDDQDFGHVSGSAPAAGLAVYKACWLAPDPSDDGCTTADTVRAIDQAVSDGVDVLNYSISDDDGAVTDVVEQAFLHASGAGVLVTAAAGDRGHRPGPVSHPSPWVTTVGAVDEPGLRGAVLLGDGRRLAGTMIAGRSIRGRRLVYAGDVRSPGVSRREAALCFPNSLDAGKVKGAVVVCDRGVTARVDKGTTVSQSGGAAMVLTNTDKGDIAADLYPIPTVHLNASRGDNLKAYIRRAPAATASVVPLPDLTTTPGVADFSGRGPVGSEGGGVLKPDITASGVSVLSAVAPPADFDRLWDFYSGTSMAAAELAGLAAVIRARQPAWSPAAVRSALLTTAAPLSSTRSPLARGVGRANVRRMLDPGLVYDAGTADWLRYLQGQGLSTTGGRTSGDDAQDLNLPTILVSNLVGDDAVTRTVTNVSERAERYVARIDGAKGVDISVSPGSVRLAPGGSATFTVSFSARRLARYERYVTGSLTWRGSLGHRVTSPVVVRAEYLSAPAEVTASTNERTIEVTATAGVTGTLDAKVRGLVGAVPVDVELTPGPFDPQSPEPGTNASVQTYDVPDDVHVARFDLRAGSAADDLDLYVYRDSRLVAQAASANADERLTLLRPTAGTYRVYVVSASSHRGRTTSAVLTGWILGHDADRKVTVTPDPLPATGSRRVDITVHLGRLDPARRWFGSLGYAGSSRRTYLTIE